MVRRLIVALTVTFAATGCSTAPGNEQPAPSTTSPTTAAKLVETTTTTPPENEPVAKKLGDQAGAGCSGDAIGSCTITFSVTKVTGCTGNGYEGDPPPAGATRKLVWMDVATGPTYSVSDLPSYLFTEFAAINADGVTTGGDLNPSLSWDCAPTQANMGFGDQNWLANKKYTGAVEIYLPDDAVKITNGEGFWEWSLR